MSFHSVGTTLTETQVLAMSCESTPEVGVFENAKGLRAHGWSSQHPIQAEAKFIMIDAEKEIKNRTNYFKSL